MTIQNSYVEFYNGTEMIGKFDVEAFEQVELVLQENENDLQEWDYFEFYMDATAEEDKGDGRYYKHEQKVSITETYNGYMEFLEEVAQIRKQIETMGGEEGIDLETLSNISKNGISNTEDEPDETRDDQQDVGD